MTSYLRVEQRAVKGNSDKRKSKEASRKPVSSRYQPLDLVEWGSLRRDSQHANGSSSLKLLLAYTAVHCVTDPIAVRTLLKYWKQIWRKTQDQQVKPRDKQDIPEEREEEQEGELTK